MVGPLPRPCVCGSFSSPGCPFIRIPKARDWYVLCLGLECLPVEDLQRLQQELHVPEER